ncbi:S41 family peptidase [Qipengyuania flava]|uniref:S41 family peptidase n=1 Tax=Qipengyuania flava TaxID=192812 RepID=UPI001C62E936|nr:S41 family peptidase [Qipengyuania flava]QYJ07010.1 peptidase S41 [Qipengyuania flava]
MRLGRALLSGTLAVALAACGGGGGSGGGNTAGGGGGGSAGGGNTGGDTCSLANRQSWVLDEMNEWYLFPSLLDTSVAPANYSTVQAYINALVAPARAQERDRFFSFITSIEEENALINSGSNAGFGVRLSYDETARTVFVVEAFENAPAFAEGLDRGTQILEIGGQSVDALMQSGGTQAVVDALGPGDPGVTRTLRIRQPDGTEITATVTKAEYSLDPVSDRYGAVVMDNGGTKVGYINLRTFIVANASDQLRDAFQAFRAEGITEIILDFRYNGGGLVSVAEVLGDLLADDKAGQIFSKTVFRASKSNFDETRTFANETQAIAATKIAIIGTSGTASASELVANAFIPFLGNNIALIGANTFGKPVGQIARDRSACDDRLRVVAFQSVNADDQGEYYGGLADVMPVTCRADDDILTPLGDPTEASIATALDFLAGRSCTSISGSGAGNVASAEQQPGRRELLMPQAPSPAQFEIPGLQ